MTPASVGFQTPVDTAPASEKKEDRSENTWNVRSAVCALPPFLPRPSVGGDALTLQTERWAQGQGAAPLRVPALAGTVLSASTGFAVEL